MPGAVKFGALTWIMAPVKLGSRTSLVWVRSLLPPIEVQVREQRAQLKKRAESVARIRDAQESLDARIGELEEALEDVQQRLDELKKFSNQARGSAARESGASPRPPIEADLPAYLRVEI